MRKILYMLIFFLGIVVFSLNVISEEIEKISEGSWLYVRQCGVANIVGNWNRRCQSIVFIQLLLQEYVWLILLDFLILREVRSLDGCVKFFSFKMLAINS